MSDLTSSTYRCGAIAILGPTNAGKSTLLNAIIGAKISIVAPKIHTTRQRIVGITTRDHNQFILVDTPGYGKNPHEKTMDNARNDAMMEACAVVYIVDALHPPDPSDIERIDFIGPIFFVMNKVDQIPREQLFERIKAFNDIQKIHSFYMISALKNQGVDDLMYAIEKVLPEAPWVFDEKDMTTMPLQMWAEEITREQVIKLYNQELPYDASIETEAWKPQKNGSIKVYQTIVVKRSGQKAIILGRGGEAIKRVSERARHEIERHLEQRIHLFLHVKCSEK